MRSSLVLAVTATLSTASAAIQGFNYGAAKTDKSFMYEQDFKEKFNAAKNLVGASGFSSARLYTMIQGGSSTNEPTQAIPAAIAEDTTLLLGLWASGGQGGIEAEITALKSAISQYGEEFTKRVVGISVGSEDLYRITPTGIAAKSGYGADPDTLVSYIKQVRAAISGTSLSDAQIGHVDTWTAWVNGSNSEVAENCDWIGFDGYPYFQNTDSNSIDNAKNLFQESLDATKQAVGGKPVWITETGWPVSGPKENEAVASLENAKTYWDEVGCPLFGNVNTWWFTLQDSDPTIPSPSFGIVGSTLSTKPLFDLSCKDVSSSSKSSTPSSTSASASKSASASVKPTSTSGSGSGSGSGSESSPSSTADSSDSSSPAESTSAPVSSGGGLSPSQGGGIPIVPTTIQSTVIATGTSPSSNGSVINTGTPSPTSTSTNVPANNAPALTGSFIAAVGAIFAAVAAL